MRAGPYVAVALLLTACATPATFKYLSSGENQPARVWPAAEAGASPETPRYRFVGELVGAPNFIDAESSRFVRAVRWLAGVDERAAHPLVLQRPVTGLVDALGRVIVTDASRAEIVVFDVAAARISTWSNAGRGARFSAPTAVAGGAGSEVLVTDAQLARVVRLDAEGEPRGVFGADVLKRPTGIARDAARGEIYVADTYAHDVKVFADDGRLLRQFGGPGSEPGRFNFPTYLAFARDQLYVVDAMNARIQIVDRNGEPRHAFGSRGLYVGNLVHPKGVAVDADGNVYVVESFHDHLLVFDGTGRFRMAIGGNGKGAGQFFLPAGVWTDAQHRVYVADMFNGRVCVFQFLGGDS